VIRERPVETRRRGEALQNALLDAAWEELQAGGYAKLTIERVAERAGTSRAVIYRRWRNRYELVIAALRHRQPVAAASIPDTGSLRDDVLAVMGTASRRISAIGPDTVVGLVNDLLADPAASEGLVDQLVRGGTEVMEVVVARAVARGEARAGVSARVARLPLDLLRHELILTRRPVSAEVIEEIVDEVFLPLVAVRA
jgi:AcrR family transcriptional regulator